MKLSSGARRRPRWRPGGGTAAVLCVVLWQAAALALGHDALAGPVPATQRLLAILGGERYRPDLFATLGSFLLALAISWCGGLLLAAWLGTRRFAGEVAEPLLVSFYAIPKVTLYPIVLLICGLGTWSKVTFGVLHGIVPVVLVGMAAIRNLKPVYARTARALSLSARATFVHVLLPAIAPQLLTGMRIGLSLTLLGTLIGEMFGGEHGIGYMLVRAINLADNDTIMALALLLMVFAIVANWLLGLAVRRFAGD
jgi:NitT/TauT family transport system permease protein